MKHSLWLSSVVLLSSSVACITEKMLQSSSQQCNIDTTRLQAAWTHVITSHTVKILMPINATYIMLTQFFIINYFVHLIFVTFLNLLAHIMVNVLPQSLKECRVLLSTKSSGQVSIIINPVVGCHYLWPGLQLPSQLNSVTHWPWLVPVYTAWWTE